MPMCFSFLIYSSIKNHMLLQGIYSQAWSDYDKKLYWSCVAVSFDIPNTLKWNIFSLL